MEPVSILVEDSNDAPVESVTVRVYDENGDFVTTGDTNGSGLVSFMLPSAASPGTLYRLYFYKVSTSFPQSQAIQVITAGNNDFEVTAEVHAVNPPPDSSTCRIYGPVIDVFGNTYTRQFYLTFDMQNDIQGSSEAYRLLSGSLSSDQDTLDFTLPRDSWVQISEHLNQCTWWCYVPDQSSLPLVDLLVPEPLSISGPVNINILVGATSSQDMLLTLSDYSVEPSTNREWSLSGILEAESDNENVATATVSSNSLVISGVAAGVTNVHVKRKEIPSYPYRHPDPRNNILSIQVTVT